MRKQTLYKNFKDLEELGMVKRTGKIGRPTLYRINFRNPFVSMLNAQVNKLSLEDCGEAAPSWGKAPLDTSS